MGYKQFVGHLMSNPFLYKYLSHNCRDKRVHAFLEGIRPKLKAIT